MSLDDIIFNFGEWLRSTPLTELALAIQKTSLNALITSNFWIVPTIQTIHILAIAALFGSALMMNLRIVQLAGHGQTMRDTVRRYLPWLWWSLLVLLISGAGMIFSDSVRNFTNPIFWMKMILLVVAIAICLVFQSSVSRNAERWEAMAGARLGVRAGAGGVMILLGMIIFAGRWIAYAPM
jgi:hypothetical protein